MTDTAKLTLLRTAIQNVLDGDYPNPRQHRPGKCQHGVFYSDACENCTDDYLCAALRAST